MFSQSVTIKILKLVGCKIKESAVYRVFLSFLGFISVIYSKSFLKKGGCQMPVFAANSERTIH